MNRYYSRFFLNKILIYILFFIFYIGTGEIFAQRKSKNKSLIDSIEINKARKLNEKVIEFSKEYIRVSKKKKDENSPEVASVLQSLGDALRRTGRAPEAEVVLLQSLEIRRRIFGESDSSVANSMFSLGNLYRVMGNLPLAETYYFKSLEMRKLLFGEYHGSVASSCHSLGSFFARIGRYSDSEVYYLRSLDIGKKLTGESDITLADSYNGLGVLYNETGDFAKAEIYLLKAIEIWKKAYGEDHLHLAYPFNNFGNLFERLGNFSSAEMYMLKSLKIYLNNFGEYHPDVADLYHNLGVLHLEKKEYNKSENYFLRSLAIKSRNMDSNSIEMASLYLNIGNFYYYTGSYSKAELKYLTSLKIYLKNLREDHPEIANVYNNLASVYSKLGNYGQSDFFYTKSLNLYKKSLGESHPSVATSYSRLGLLNLEHGNLEKAEVNYLHFQKIEQEMLKRYFPFLADTEKEKYFETERPYINVFKTFCLLRYVSNPSITADLYNHQLVTKAVLLNSSSKWRRRIKSSGNPELNVLFEAWTESRNMLNQLIQSTDSTERLGIDSVRNKTDKMEKMLSLMSENFSQLTDKTEITWRDIQKTLKSGEAAVEIIRIHKFGVRETIIDTSDILQKSFQVKGLTDTICYSALIVKKDSEYPELVVLENGNELETKYLSQYKKCIQKRMIDKTSYAQFWHKIDRKLVGINKVYISPDGVYHKLNLSTLQNPVTKQYLFDEKDIRLVTVTKDLVEPQIMGGENKKAVLFGFPSYFKAKADSLAGKISNNSSGFKNFIGSLNELPATRSEIKIVADILKSRGWNVADFTAETATEENIKSAFKPIILHVATHGFFQAQDTNTSNDPLFRSGLMLANAGETLNGNKSLNAEDGILTSAEAMNLNLDNTELVVLSACETGLGEIKNGEGVYGLQRAFKVAGAKSIIMSLWKVSDDATQELMVSFYKNWLNPTQHARRGRVKTSTAQSTKIAKTDQQKADSWGLGTGSKRSAFLKAQKELKVKYPDPFYWGAFVMVGE